MYSFFFNDTATTEIYTLSLHDALPIWTYADGMASLQKAGHISDAINGAIALANIRITQGRLREAMSTYERGLRLATRSEEHTSELQSRQYLVCRLLLEKKKNN